MHDIDTTVAAIATPPGRGGIAIVRISGPDSKRILKQAFAPARAGARFMSSRMVYGHVTGEDGRPLDEAMAVFFKAPRTYTRQDVAEIHTHGGLAAEAVLKRALSLGAAPAERGEFTYRAFINGRIDLSEAQAVMDVISADSAAALRNSVDRLRGGESGFISEIKQRLLSLTALIDAQSDFPEEIDEGDTLQSIRKAGNEMISRLESAADPARARIISQGARAVICGRANAGKSSLMNALLRTERAIVTDIPGTTRDEISEVIEINGVKLTLTDTAGIRETGDPIEKIGVERAKKLIDTADAVILLLDGSRPLNDEDRQLLAMKDERFIVCRSKDDMETCPHAADLVISARTGEGLKELTDAIYSKLPLKEDDGALISLRHMDAADRALTALKRAVSAPYLPLARQDITDALAAIGEITGETLGEDAISLMFESFCVGK